MVWIFLATFSTCLMSTAALPVVTISLINKPLKCTRMYCPTLSRQDLIYTPLGVLGLVKVWKYVFVLRLCPIIILRSLTPFFPTATIISSDMVNVSFWDFEFLMRVRLAFGSIERFHFEDIFSIPQAVHLPEQNAFCSLFAFSRNSSAWNNFLY